MKSFIASVIALTVMVTSVALNCIYIENKTEKMLDLANQIEQNQDAVFELKNLWDKEKFKICISTPHKTTDEIEKYINLIIDNPESLKEYKSFLTDAIKEIIRHERPSFDSIF